MCSLVLYIMIFFISIYVCHGFTVFKNKFCPKLGVWRTTLRRPSFPSGRQLHGQIPVPVPHITTATAALGRHVVVARVKDSAVPFPYGGSSVRLYRPQCHTWGHEGQCSIHTPRMFQGKGQGCNRCVLQFRRSKRVKWILLLCMTWIYNNSDANEVNSVREDKKFVAVYVLQNLGLVFLCQENSSKKRHCRIVNIKLKGKNTE